MKALVKYAKGEGNVEIRDVPVPGLAGGDWVLVKVKACGVCGTDIHVWQEKFQNWPPVTLGHEFSGEIVETGPKVTRFKVGDRVVAEPNTGGCGKCSYCRTGNMHLCPEKLTLGWRINGAMAEYAALPELVLHRIPDNLSYIEAALCEPMAIVVYAVAERGRIDINDVVLVQGCGPIGILSAYMAKMLGARTVIITGVDKSEAKRLPVALEAGADIAVNVQKQDLGKVIEDVTKGCGVDVIIESSGAAPVIEHSVDYLKKMGRLIALGIPEGSVCFPWNVAALKNIDVRFNMSSSYSSWDRALDRLSKDKDILCKLITDGGSIDNWERCFNNLLDEKDIKTIFTF